MFYRLKLFGVAHDGHHIEAKPVVDIVFLYIMVGGMSNVFYLFHIHGIGRACHIVISSCFNLHEHEGGAIGCACYDVDVASRGLRWCNPYRGAVGLRFPRPIFQAHYVLPFFSFLFFQTSVLSNERSFKQAVLSNVLFYALLLKPK